MSEVMEMGMKRDDTLANGSSHHLGEMRRIPRSTFLPFQPNTLLRRIKSFTTLMNTINEAYIIIKDLIRNFER